MKPQASQSFLLAARLSPRAVPATRHQTTTKPAVQAEKTILPEPGGSKGIVTENRLRNPGNKSPNPTNPLFTILTRFVQSKDPPLWIDISCTFGQILTNKRLIFMQRKRSATDPGSGWYFARFHKKKSREKCSIYPKKCR